MTFPQASVRNDSNSTPLVSSPQDLTVECFARLLQDYYSEPRLRITELVTRTLSVAILSQVVQVSIVIDESTLTATPHTTDTIPKSFIVKFLKESVPLKEMFRVEATFYRNYASDHVAFFHTPTLLYSSETCLVLEQVLNTHQFTLLEGCPASDLPEVLTGLARLHAGAWHPSDYKSLSSVPGMGSALNGLNKERQFGTKYAEYLERLYAAPQLEPSSSLPPLDKMTCLCQDLATRRLREIHAAVHQYRPTLIHGDFHVGNLLKRETNNKEGTEDKGSLWYLLDWATCGAGNPLMDLVFFLLVSTRATPDDAFDTWLPHYYQALIQANPSIGEELAYESCVDVFRECLLDEFLILVCYDDVSRDLLRTECSDETQRFFQQHFTNVNTRAVRILQSSHMSGYPLPPHKSKADLELERQQEPEWRQKDHALTEI